jgi:hypothetical protein
MGAVWESWWAVGLLLTPGEFRSKAVSILAEEPGSVATTYVTPVLGTIDGAE